MNKRGIKVKGKEWSHKKVLVVGPPCCFDLYHGIIRESREIVKDIIFADPDRKDAIECKHDLNHFSIRAVPAYHKDIQSDSNCLGIIIENKNTGKHLIGFTGDTVWTKGLYDNLKTCSVVCMNMGALLDVRKGHSFKQNLYDASGIKKLMYEQNHLYLPGVITLLEQFRKKRETKFIIIGELGEELKFGLRKDLFYQFNKYYYIKNKKDKVNKEAEYEVYSESPFILLEDIGLTLTWNSDMPAIRCARCKNPIKKINKIGVRIIDDTRKDEQMNYYCNKCLRVLEALEKGVETNWQVRY